MLKDNSGSAEKTFENKIKQKCSRLHCVRHPFCGIYYRLWIPIQMCVTSHWWLVLRFQGERQHSFSLLLYVLQIILCREHYVKSERN